MAFVTGVILIDAPASALNNAGQDTGARTDNQIAVKKIPGPRGLSFPYVSAQAVRFWLRTTLERTEQEWRAAPVFREQKVAYTDGNPIEYWDDDLFGYMRAASKKKGARESDDHLGTPTTTELTRVSPLRVGTFVSLAPVRVVSDFGTMARQSGDPVPHEHEFYRATLRGSVSLDLGLAGTFFAGGRVGFRNLDDEREGQAAARGLQEVTVRGQRAYRLPVAERARRVVTLLRGLAALDGGAKQALHYTDVNPTVVALAVMRGGNNPLHHIFSAGEGGSPVLVPEALREVARVFADQMLSPVYVGWPRGYADDQRAVVEEIAAERPSGVEIVLDHPRLAVRRLCERLETAAADSAGTNWFDD